MRIFALGALLISYGAFSVWTYAQGSHLSNARLSDRASVRGKQLFQAHNCAACHQLFGLGGYLGPDLTHVLDRRSPADIRLILKHGGRQMPDLHLTATQIEDLLSYLTAIRQVAQRAGG